MSESRSRVTITLGRTGQVVKKVGSVSDGSLADSLPVVGRKRSVRERLGNGADSSGQFNNKRLRGDGRTSRALNDVQLSKDDLRHKILRKSKLKQNQNNQQSVMDLRNILSRPAQSSTNSIATRERMPEPKDTKPRYLDPRDGRQQFAEPRDGRQHFTEPKDGRQHFTVPRDGRQVMPVTRDSNQHLQEHRLQNIPDPREQHMKESREERRSNYDLDDVRHRFPEPNNSRIVANVSGSRATNTVTKVESGFDPYSPWNLDSLRRRSPDEALATSRGLSAATRDEELQRRYAVRTHDEAKTSTYMSKAPFEFSIPTSSSSYLTKTAPPVGPMKTMNPGVPASLPPTSSLAQKSSYVVEDHPTVESFLRSIGLEKYAILFKVEEVDMYSLRRMTELDLRELGIPMGPRKKILLYLQPRVRQA
ncbi:hypothetical protein ACJIZ3_025581 [Penstemon smallii]|uniref:SAM domain-containing protein n=1 Tax=Penstemon smallii TaxID=265156 RepID=A0ABD3TVZ8_9LAMI